MTPLERLAKDILHYYALRRSDGVYFCPRTLAARIRQLQALQGWDIDQVRAYIGEQVPGPNELENIANNTKNFKRYQDKKNNDNNRKERA